MKGQRPDGRAASYTRRECGRPVPSGPLSQARAIALRQTVARGLSGLRYTAGQIGQILGCSERSVKRFLATAPDPTLDPTPESAS
jgi:hypothetical protein